MSGLSLGDIAEIVGLIFQAAMVYFAASIKAEISGLKAHVYENFVSKADAPLFFNRRKGD